MKWFITLLLFWSLTVLAEPPKLEFVKDPKTVGKTRLEVLFWDIYEAELIAPEGKWDKDKPFALRLTYLRDFEGKEIASRSVDEMRDLGFDDELKLAKWFQKMHRIFPDVKEGECIMGIVDEDKVSHFYFNDEKIGKVTDAEFTEWFFAIWLSEDTSEPKMREQLLGMN
ncbi:chalcone isomerase family protein [Glaciecola sp. 1036]|uniref:chalcone isomerase family protein n=1 Tax=Alteromonadaceae TaxID=72275 RepID=UPI003D041852